MAEIIENFNSVFSGKILIAVPHSDDEIIGCGFLLKNFQDKKNLFLIYFTDNIDEHSKKSYYSKITQIRKNEAVAGLNSLNIASDNLTFLNLLSSDLKNKKKYVQEILGSLIKKLRPDFLFVPFRYDFHPDHINVNRIFDKEFVNSFPGIKTVEYFVYYNWKLLPQKDVRKLINDDFLWLYNPSPDDSQCKKELFRFYQSQTSLFYNNLTRPVLKEKFISNVSSQPEYYLKSFKEKKSKIFSLNPLILKTISFAEPFLKKMKDNIFGQEK